MQEHSRFDCARRRLSERVCQEDLLQVLQYLPAFRILTCWSEAKPLMTPEYIASTTSGRLVLP
jgi:hypothetical protein